MAKALGYARANDAITVHCRSTVKRRIPHPQSKTKQIEILFIPEGDVYRHIAHNPVSYGSAIIDVLGYSNYKKALKDHVDTEEKTLTLIHGGCSTGAQKTSTLIQNTGSNYKSMASIINESGLYHLILSSRLPQAKEFKRWVT